MPEFKWTKLNNSAIQQNLNDNIVAEQKTLCTSKVKSYKIIV
jgi:hypothetical protein